MISRRVATVRVSPFPHSLFSPFPRFCSLPGQPSSSLHCSTVHPPILIRKTALRLAKSAFSSQANSNSSDRTNDRPQMFHLEHIQKRLEYTVPLMFHTRLDYTFYRSDVVLEDQIFQTTTRGLGELMQHMAYLSIVGNVCNSHIEAQALNISPIIEDGTVRLRWRILHLGWFGMLNLRNFNREYRKKNLRWYDGYSIFYVDGEGMVYKATIQKTMPDESLTISSMKDKTKEFVKRRVLPSPSPNCAAQQPIIKFAVPPTRQNITGNISEGGTQEERRLKRNVTGNF